jgi:hypothetical protein
MQLPTGLKCSLGFLLLLAAAAWCGYLWRAFLPLQIGGNEAWNATHTLRWLNGLALYPDRDALLVNNYPPLSFFIHGFLTPVTGTPVLAGRLLSLASIPIAGLAVAGIIAELGGRRLAAATGAVFFVAAMSIGAPFYVGMNDPSVLALAVMSLGLWLVLRAESRKQTAVPALLLMVLAGFIKHNLVATPLVAVVWLFLMRGRRTTGEAAVAILAALGGLAVCFMGFGPAFFDNLLMPRTTHWQHLFLNWEYLPWDGIIVCCAWLFSASDNRAKRFVALYLPIAFFLFMLQKTGEGVALNAQFEVVVATAIGAGFGLVHFVSKAHENTGTARQAAVFLTIIMIKQTAWFGYNGAAQPLSAEFRARIAERAAITLLEIEKIRSRQGPIQCSVTLVCVLAGHPLQLDDFGLSQRVATGTWTKDELERRVLAAQVISVVIDERARWPK